MELPDGFAYVAVVRPEFSVLESPVVSADQLAEGTLRLRYEDIAQDGALAPSVLSAGVGVSVWEKLMANPAAQGMWSRGEIPILTRLVLASGEGPVSVGAPVTIRGAHRFSHVRLDSGEVDRILLEMWASARAPRGHTHGPVPGPEAEIVTAGRLYAEHVLTRLFAAKGDRKVRRLEVPGMPEVPAPEVPFVSPARTGELPMGAHALGEARMTSVAFGMSHSDANQHVNSLVYLRMAEDAALVHLKTLGRGPALSIELAEAAYRKPSFAGESLSLVLQAFETSHEGRARVGVFGGFVDEGGPLTEARTFVRLLFR